MCEKPHYPQGPVEIRPDGDYFPEEPSMNYPSWEKLLQLLVKKGGLGVGDTIYWAGWPIGHVEKEEIVFHEEDSWMFGTTIEG
jgi:hypothetical protein